MTDYQTILFALLGGVLPALLWLFFWLREDRKNPEPRGLIMRTFLFGMLAVIIVLPFQKFVDSVFPGMILVAIFLLVVLEEIFKLAAAWAGGLKSPEDNEPIDPMIYMITAALGFTALENALFIFGPFSDNEFTAGIITGNLRFIGASLLHVVSSAFIGVALGFSFYKTKIVRASYVAVALALAIAFHAGFNLAIIHLDEYGLSIAFGAVWFGVILTLLAFEKVKMIAR